MTNDLRYYRIYVEFIQTGGRVKGQIKINPKTGIAYFPDNIRQEGFEGTVELLANAKTVTLFLPGASLDEIERSLLIVLDDIRLRRGGKDESQKPK